MSSPSDSLQVVCAIITNEAHEILACQRSSTTAQPDKWEFPGGKIEADETKEAAIVREIQEELGVTISLTDELNVVEHQYPDFHISLHPFMCEIANEAEPQALEHASIRWIKLKAATTLDWAEADREILSHLQETAEN